MPYVHAQVWGDGVPVVLVHGSLDLGHETWQGQRPLADEGYRLIVVNRRGYGDSRDAGGEDYVQDGRDLVELLGDGAHLVGHSYGGQAVLFAAADRLQSVLSLTLIEPPLDRLASAGMPALVVSGGHDAAFDAVCDELTDRLDARKATITGAGHEVPMMADELNRTLSGFWRSV